MISFRLLCLTFLAFQGISSAWSQSLPAPAGREIDFSSDIEPILEERCYSCHSAAVAMNGYSMWRRKSAIRGGYSGEPAIEPGNSAASRLIHLVSGREPNLIMPPVEGPLPAHEIALLRAWIDQGVDWKPEMEEPTTDAPKEWLEMDYGSLISGSITVRRPEDPRATKGPYDNVAYKAHAISLTPERDAAVLFDTELLRYAAGWSGGFLVLTGTVYDWAHGPHPYADGKPVFETPVEPGWAREESFEDPRASGFGPLPRKWGRYRGRYVHGDQNVLSYTVGTTEVLDMPALERSGSLAVFTRSLEIGPHEEDLLLQVAGPVRDGATVRHLSARKVRFGSLLAAVQGGDAEWVVEPGQPLRLRIVANREESVLTISLTKSTDELEFQEWLQGREPARFLRPLTRGGPSRFPERIETEGKLGADSAPWVVDEITLPQDNPWNSWMRPGDFSFFADDRAAVTTWSGDVWVVSGVDQDLDRLTWRRMATGFHQPLGLEVVDGTIYVLDRNQVTRLHDLNGDGEADFYENFNHDFEATHHFHEFTFDLDRDEDGNFYFAKAARHALPASVRHHGTILKLDPSGDRLEIFSRGFRVPNGVSLSPGGAVTTSDQEGHWIPSTAINWCTRGSYHGYAWGGSVDPEEDEFTRPLTYLPIEADNSGAGQAWVPSGDWGPFRGQLVHASYGRGRIFVVLAEEVEGTVQGGAYQLPFYLDTGLLRPDFRARDGQLYACGLKGWGTTTDSPGGFYRVRYTGRRVNLPVELHVNRTDGIAIRFPHSLDASSIADLSRYSVKRWNYRRTSRYGSERFRMDGEQGIEEVRVRGARLSADETTLFLDVEDLREVDQMLVGIDIRDGAGEPILLELFHTINKLSDARGEPILSKD